ncbi:MAG: PKD domain-containing protein [Solirubrobacteraceae bacterium]|nr:PKD domain-containing protein [Solirubrobacteraceae bacterium]
MTLVAAALAVLVVPAAAHAATYTVKAGDGPCGGADLACGGLVEAAAIAQPGDVFNLATGVYPAPTFTVGGVTINGDLGAAINGTIEFAGASGGPSVLSKVAVSQGTSAAPGIYVSGQSGLILQDSVVVSRDGFGVLISAGGNKIERSLVATGGQSTGAIQVESGPGTGGSKSPAKALTVDSSIVYGGGAGVRAITRNNEVEALAGNGAGDITLALRHITAAGSSNGVDIDSSNAVSLLGNNIGSIHATISDSIAFSNRVVNFSGTLGLPLLGANTATLTRTRTLESGDRNALFLDPAGANFRLRPDAAAAINQGGVTPGESPTDIDGEDRSTAPTDLGADEYNPAAPTAAIAVATATPRNAQPVTFDGRASSHRDAAGGGGIVQYRWRFSDGRSAVTTEPFVQHTFAEAGDAAAALIVVSAQGAVSPEAVVVFKLADGIPPRVGIVTPRANQTLRLFTTRTRTVTRNGQRTRVRTRTRNRVRIAGLSQDASGVQRVVLTIQKITARTTGTQRCHYYNPTRGFRLVSCSRPALINARLTRDSANGEWTYNVPLARPLSTGSYRVRAFGVDRAGTFGNSADARSRVIRFTIRR